MNAVDGLDASLLHVVDVRTNEVWLVDSGALISIIPPTDAQRRKGPSGPTLQAANGTPIPCYGTIRRIITIGNRDFDFEFVIADVQHQILGADFLTEFYLAPNHRDGVLLDLNPQLPVDDFEDSSPTDFLPPTVLPATLAKGVHSTPVNYVDQKNDPFYQLLDSYPTLLTPSFKLVEVNHGVTHHIPTEGRPIQSRARKLAPDKLAIAKAEFEKLVELGVCYRGKSEWSSPLMVAKKPCPHPCTCHIEAPCGGWRVCGDYRRLNNATVDDKYPVRSLTDFNVDLAGKTIFSKIDLLKGYHQIPVEESDIRKTAVITPFGLFIFPRTPFGLKNAGQDFQRLMDEVLEGVPHTFVYLDDVLVASTSPTEHLDDLRCHFDALADNGLVVNRKKCVLGQATIDFLGFKVDATGISPLPHRVEAVREFAPPQSVKDLQRFLGLIGYYRRFIPKAAHHMCALFDTLKGKPKALVWTDACQSSFVAIKEALASATLLHHPIVGAPLALTTDASNIAIGGVLEQRGKKGWEPLAFYSAKLQPNQRDWPPYDRELLAAFKTVRHFKHMVEGRPFTLYTDHQSLVPSMSKKTDPQTSRQMYQLSCISEFTTDIRYVQGKANLVADALSRPSAPESLPLVSNVVWNGMARPGISQESSTLQDPQNAFKRLQDLQPVVNAIGSLGLDLNQMALEQPLDKDFQQLSADSRSGLKFQTVDLGHNQLIVDISNGPARPFVPYAWRRRVFDTIHGLGHPGVERTRQSVASKFVWPTMRQDVSRWARECHQCQQSKINRHTSPPFGEFTVPQKRFCHINLDIVGPLPSSNGFRYLLTAVDRFTRWPMAAPLVNITSESVVDAFAHNWVANFGVPSSITTDRGAQFSSAIWQQLLAVWGIKSHHTTAYHPAANGMVERFHRRLKEALMALAEDVPNDWYWRLPCALLSIRTTLKPDISASPADLVYGEGLAVPGDLLPASLPSEEDAQEQRQSTLDNLRLEVARLQPTQTSSHRRPRVHIPEQLRTASHVYVRRGGVQPSLNTPYTGPYRVVSREANSFKVAIPGRGNDSVALERLKPAIVSTDGDPQDGIPPSPPSPRAGVRTGQPQPTTRQTRNTVANEPIVPQATSAPQQRDLSPSAVDPGEGTSDQGGDDAQFSYNPRRGSLAHPLDESFEDARNLSLESDGDDASHPSRTSVFPNAEDRRLPPSPPPAPPPQSFDDLLAAPPRRRRRRVRNIDEFGSPRPPLTFDDWLTVGAASLDVARPPRLPPTSNPRSRGRPDVSYAAPLAAILLQNQLDNASVVNSIPLQSMQMTGGRV